MGRATSALLVALGMIATAGCSESVRAIAHSQAHSWRAAPGTRVSLAPLLDAGDAGWCLDVVTRIVTGTTTRSSRGCLKARTTSGPIFAEACEGAREGAVLYVLTQSSVRSVSVEGGAPAATAGNSTLPDGLRAAALQGPGYQPPLGFYKRCPAVTPFNARGEAMFGRAGPAVPLSAKLPSKTWARPDRPPPGVCRLTAAKLRPGTVPLEGSVSTALRPVRGVLGSPFVSCARTVYVHGGGEYITAAILLDAALPGEMPPALPAMKPRAGHPGFFEASSSEGQLVARRVPGAWLVATEQTPSGFAVPVELLEGMHAAIAGV
jgi:hypothetical protein